MGRKKILLVDEHPVVLLGIKELLKSENDFDVIGAVTSTHDAKEIIKNAKPDVITCGLCYSNKSGIEFVKEIKFHSPVSKILIISIYNETLYAERTIRAGASGFLMKAQAQDNIITAIKEILNGEIYLSPSMKEYILEKALNNSKKNKSLNEGLTNIEIEIFSMLGDGYKSKAIAEKLCRSVKTIETHKMNIKYKLKLQTAQELLNAAVTFARDLY